jgi:type I restriction enzyme S subunit
MSPARLLQYFDQISEAPDAVPRLRRFILDLALRGKLVEQDPTDEPAVELLRRIHEERRRSFKERKSKQQVELSTAISSELSELPGPCGWVVTTLGSVSQKITDGTHKTPAYVNKGVPFVSVKDFSGGRLDFSNTRFISPEEHAVLYKRCDPRRGDILIGRIGTLGKAVLVDTDAEFSLFVSVGLIRFSHDFIVPTYLRLALNSPFVESEFDRIKVGGGTHTNKLNLEDLHTVGLPLPPLAEQHRIVAKVDELMALCDELEAAQAKRERRRDRLVAATLHGLNNGDANSESGTHSNFEDSARFYFNHLPRLTTRPEHIHQLRQTILTLAVRGRLVEHSSSEGTADSAIEEIDRERSRLVAEGALGRQARIPPVGQEQAPFALPSTWLWVRFGNITFCRDGERVPVSREERQHRLGPYDYYGASGVIDKIDAFLFDKPLLLIGEDGANLINRSTPIAFIAHGKYWVNNHAHVLDGISEGLLRYLELYINATDLRPYVTGTAQPKMNQAKMNSIAVALPPLAEQHRIVAKVDELMALCDELEARISTTATTRRQLLEAALHETLGSLHKERTLSRDPLTLSRQK